MNTRRLIKYLFLILFLFGGLFWVNNQANACDFGAGENDVDTCDEFAGANNYITQATIDWGVTRLSGVNSGTVSMHLWRIDGSPSGFVQYFYDNTTGVLTPLILNCPAPGTWVTSNECVSTSGGVLTGSGTMIYGTLSIGQGCNDPAANNFHQPGVCTYGGTVPVSFYAHANCAGESISGSFISTNLGASGDTGFTDGGGYVTLNIPANTNFIWFADPPSPNPAGYGFDSGSANSGSGGNPPIDVQLDRACGGICNNNGVVDSGEECDGGDLNGQSCLFLGLSGSGLACNSECFFDTSPCTSNTCVDDSTMTFSNPPPATVFPNQVFSFSIVGANNGVSNSHWWHGAAYSVEEISGLRAQLVFPDPGVCGNGIGYSSICNATYVSATHEWIFSEQAPSGIGPYFMQWRMNHAGGWAYHNMNGTTCPGPGINTKFGQTLTFNMTVVQQPPGVATNDPSDVTTNSATLNGTVNPNGGPTSTTAGFRWDSTNVACSSLPNVTATSVHTGTNPIAITPQNIGGLSPSTTYYFCATATNGGGTAYGSVLSFTTSALSPVNDAQFISQNVPSLTMTPNSTQSVSVTMRNIGTSTWTAANQYNLGSQNPENNLTWGLGRVIVPSNISPGSNAVFNFTITAPSTPNTYNFQWGMVRDSCPGCEWFGQLTTNLQITVGNLPATPTGLNFNCSTDTFTWNPSSGAVDYNVGVDYTPNNPVPPATCAGSTWYCPLNPNPSSSVGEYWVTNHVPTSLSAPNNQDGTAYVASVIAKNSFGNSSWETLPFTCAAPQPNLVITSMTVPDGAPGATGTASVTIQNTGTVATSVGFEVGLHDGSPLLRSITCEKEESGVPTALLGAGAIRVVSIPFTYPAASAYTARAMVDSDCAIAETNEADNVSSDAYSSTASIPSVYNVDVTVTNSQYCTVGPHAEVTWSYTDPVSSPQDAYRVQVYEVDLSGNIIGTAVHDSCGINNTFDSCNPAIDPASNNNNHLISTGGGLQFGRNYRATVQVMNTFGSWSPVVSMSEYCNSATCSPPNLWPNGIVDSWPTPAHAFPTANFLPPVPANPAVGLPVTFTDNSSFCNGGSCGAVSVGRTWNWNFGGGVPTPTDTATQGPYSVVFASAGTYTVTLNVSDDVGSCPAYSPSFDIQRAIPRWREVAPR